MELYPFFLIITFIVLGNTIWPYQLFFVVTQVAMIISFQSFTWNVSGFYMSCGIYRKILRKNSYNTFVISTGYSMFLGTAKRVPM